MRTKKWKDSIDAKNTLSDVGRALISISWFMYYWFYSESSSYIFNFVLHLFCK